MVEKNIKPEKITKPIQLLGAWLAGLFSVDSCFLVAAAKMQLGSFESIALVLAAIANVPIFLAAVFLLQTKFRPELQEDSYYSSYLSQKTNQKIVVSKTDSHIMELSERISAIEKDLSRSEEVSANDSLDGIFIGVNKHFKDREDIKKRLANYGVKGVSSFGGIEKPNVRSVVISYSVPQDYIDTILKVARESGFTHYGFFHNRAEETDEEVLFGGYGSSEFELI